MVEEDGEKIVVEGNRRVAAVKLFRDPALAKSVGIVVPAISKKTEASLETIHVIKLKDREQARQLGFKHINGTHKWDSYAKARFAAEWYRAEKNNGTTLEDIARSLGDRHDTVQRLVQGILVLGQAVEEGLFHPEDRFPGRLFFFSHRYTASAMAELRIIERSASHSVFGPATISAPRSCTLPLPIDPIPPLAVGSPGRPAQARVRRRCPGLRHLWRQHAHPRRPPRGRSQPRHSRAPRAPYPATSTHARTTRSSV